MKGLYYKYNIEKTNGKPFADGFYAIVLRIDGGQYVDACRAGAFEFAQSVREENEELWKDLHLKLAELNPRKITTVFRFPNNGMCAVCDQFGNQMGEYQGSWDDQEEIIRLIAPNAEYNL